MPDWWDFITEKVSESWETFTGYFTNLSEFSKPGLVAGLIMVAVFILTNGFFIINKLKIPSGQKLLIFILGIIGVFAVGYIMISHAFNE